MTVEEEFLAVKPQVIKTAGALVSKWGLGRDLVDDIVQETYYKAIKYQKNYTLGTNPRAYLNYIANNVVIDMYRTKKRKGFPEHIPAEEAYDLADTTPEMGELSDEMKNALNLLSPVNAQIMMLQYVLDYSIEEVALITNIPEGTVKSRMFRARQTMKDYLKSKQ